MDLTRREFMVGCSAAIAALAGARISNLAFAAPGDPTRRDILVTIFLRGGCDGLTLVAPTTDLNYVTARRDLRVLDAGSTAGIRIDNPIAPLDFRLHPSAAPLKELYDSANLAIVHACGLTNATRSHFDAMDYMESGLPNDKNGNGWLARHLTSIGASGAIPVVAASSSTPKALRGLSSAIALTDPANFRVRSGSNTYAGQVTTALRALYTGDTPLHQAGQSTLDAVNLVSSRLPVDANGRPLPYQPENGAAYSTSVGTSLAGALRTIAQLIKLDVGLQAATVDFGGWDTHDAQGSIIPTLIDGLSRALHAFYNDMVRYYDRLTIVVMSEFGRRLKANQSSGTDHGHGNVMFVLGGYVNGGRMFGSWPGLAVEQLDNGVDLAITTDYRSVLQEILVNRCGNPAIAQVFPDFTAYQPLGLVRTAGTANPPPVGRGPLTNKVRLPVVRR